MSKLDSQKVELLRSFCTLPSFSISPSVNHLIHKELSVSFNKMAQELPSIETLRSDFVNDFSHEFKTPIVSVRGQLC